MKSGYDVRDAFGSIVDSLNNASFPGLEEYDVGDCLYFDIRNYLLGVKPPHPILTLIAPFCVRTYCYDLTFSESDVVFFKSYMHDFRGDLVELLEKVKGYAKSGSYISGSQTRKISFKNLRNVSYAIKWSKILNNLGIRNGLKILVVAQLAKMMNFKDLIDSRISDIEKHSCVVSLCDQLYDEAMVIQLARRSGLKSAALQHGHFWGEAPGNQPYDPGYPYEHLIADYILVWGEYSKKIAMRMGVKEDRIKVVGNPKKEYETLVFEEKSRKGSFGLVLEGRLNDGESLNRRLLTFAESLAKQTSMKCVIKMHPANQDSELRRIIEENEYFVEYDALGSLDGFSEAVDFAISCGSTVYAELISRGLVVFRYVDLDYFDRYDGLDFATFEDDQSLLTSVVRFFENEAELKQGMRNHHAELFRCGDVKSAYRDAILEICGSDDS